MNLIFVLFLILTLSLIDLAELDIPDTIKLDFPDASNILNFNVTIHPDEGKRKQ